MYGYDDYTRQVCAPAYQDKGEKIAIGSGVFEHIKDEYGEVTVNSISFISTGPNCWVDIFSKQNQKGSHYEITPLKDVLLNEIPLDTVPGMASFNDNIMSGYIFSTDSENRDPDSKKVSVSQLSIWYTFNNVKRVVPDPYCGYFYDLDPNVNDANGFAICLSEGSNLAHISRQDMKDRGLLESMRTEFIDNLEGSTGIHYVEVGPKVAVSLWVLDDFKGIQSVIKPESAAPAKNEVNSITIYTSNDDPLTDDEMGLVPIMHGIENIFNGKPPEDTYLPPPTVYIAPTDIFPGCARFYISDPHWGPGTKFYQVCAPTYSDSQENITIGSGVFEHIQDKFGHETENSISYISTGPKCWVNIFTQKDHRGIRYSITPLSDVLLSEIPLTDPENPKVKSWNDNIISGTIRSTDSYNENPDGNKYLTKPGITPIAVWYAFTGVRRIEPDSGCGYYYDRDPNIQKANGFALCISTNQNLAHANLHDLITRGLLRFARPTLYDKLVNSTGIYYVEAGPDVDVTVFAEDEFKGASKEIKTGIAEVLNQELTSIILQSSRYHKTTVVPFTSSFSARSPVYYYFFYIMAFVGCLIVVVAITIKSPE